MLRRVQSKVNTLERIVQAHCKNKHNIEVMEQEQYNRKKRKTRNNKRQYKSYNARKIKNNRVKTNHINLTRNDHMEEIMI